MNKHLLFITGAILLLLLNSCLSPSKLYYFHDQAVHSKDTIDVQRKNAVPKIQKGDKIAILVTSNSPEVTQFLNPYNQTNTGGGNANTAGFLVNMDGEVDFPLIGKVMVSGLTSEEAAAVIRKKLEVYYKNPYVYVTLSGRVFVLTGRNGNTIPMSNERLTIYEAIAMANSGVDTWDKKTKVWVVREENGIRTYDRLNLNSKYIFKSPYYYLHNNDLIYIQPSWISSAWGNNSPVKNLVAIASGLIVLFFSLRKI